MKKKWFRTMDLVDEAFVEEANPNARAIHLRRKRIVTAIVASAACFALTLTSLWLFLPYDDTPPSIEHHEEDNYYAVIEKLNVLKQEQPEYENKFDMIVDNVGDVLLGGVKGDAVEEVAPIAPGAIAPNGAVAPNGMAPTVAPADRGDGGMDTSTNSGSTYEEITDNQVAGITEADRIKRSSTHIYYLDGNTLKIFFIAGKDSAQVGSIQLDENAFSGYLLQWEFYLSADCKTATVFTRYRNQQDQMCVGVISVDVSDPMKPAIKNKQEIVGNYLSSRVTDGKILLMTEYVFERRLMDFEKEETFLPQINGKSIASDCIVLPEEVSATRYTVVMKLDENTLEIEGQSAFLSYSKEIYVSQDHIFLTHVYADQKKLDDDKSIRNSMTEISCLAYKDSFEQKGTVVVRGYVKDQWSMDEYEGILRVVTTTNATTVRENSFSSYVYGDILMTATGDSNASLYCIDLKELKIVASVEDFAPPREEVRSVRFDKTTAYVCTAIEISDPVYFFDLSDLNNITYKDTGNIEGFSSSLVNMGDGYLLGIGQENWRTLKIEIYKETETGVKGFCKYTLQNVSYSEEYKSYYIDRENQFVGLGITGNSNGQSQYILLHFNGNKLEELVRTDLLGANELKRAVYIDGFLYLFGKDTFKVIDVFDNSGNIRNLVNIVDATEEQNITVPAALELFYETAENEYYFPAIKSQYIKAVYADGETEPVVDALNAGRVTLQDLDAYNIKYYVKFKK